MIEAAQRPGATPRNASPAGDRRLWRAVVLSAAVLSVLVAGCSARHYRTKVDKTAYKIIAEKQQAGLNRTEAFTVDRPSDTLRKRLLLDQFLPVAGPASLGSEYLGPVPHWPERREPVLPRFTPAIPSQASTQVLVLTLNSALYVAARNSREYQDEKETLFSAALDVDMARDEFRTTFGGLLSTLFEHNRAGLNDRGGDVEESFEAEAMTAAAKKLKSGSLFTLRLGWNLVKMLQPNRSDSHTFFGDASVAIPMLRGSGKYIAAEPLTLAERKALYAVYTFERFKREFAVRVAREYLSALQRTDRVMNAEENYRGLIASTRRARRLLDAGILPAFQVDQSIQQELNARNRWIIAVEAQTAAMDSFKALLGLPVDAAVELDRAEFEKLSQGARRLTGGTREPAQDQPVPPADAPIILEEPSRRNAGPLELAPEVAIRIALTNRLDLRVAEGRIYDAQRAVVVAADQLRPELTFFGRASVSGDTLRKVNLDRGNYQALLVLDPGFERTAESIDYRASLLMVEATTRNFQALEDEVKLGVRSRLRTLREARETVQIQDLGVELARRRVRGADLNLQAGRAQIRDLLEAQQDLLAAQNAFTAAAVDYRLAELELQRDLDVLEVGSDGLWKEFNPATVQ